MRTVRLAAIAAALCACLHRRSRDLRARFAAIQPIPTEDIMETYRRALETMAQDQRTVFLLHLREERSITEIADELSLSSAEIEQLLSQAIAHIGNRLDTRRS